MEIRRHTTVEGNTTFVTLVTIDGLGVVRYSIDKETNISLISCLSVDNEHRHRKIGTQLLLNALFEIDHLEREARIYIPKDNLGLKRFCIRNNFLVDKGYEDDTRMRMVRKRRFSLNRFITFILSIDKSVGGLSRRNIVGVIYHNTADINKDEILRKRDIGDFIPLGEFIEKNIDDDNSRCSIEVKDYSRDSINVYMRVGNNPCLVLTLPREKYEKQILHFLEYNK